MVGKKLIILIFFFLLFDILGLSQTKIDLLGTKQENVIGNREVIPDTVELIGFNARSFTEVERKFEKQKLRIQIFIFEDWQHALSAFTFFKKNGAKPYEGFENVYVQNSEAIFWKGNRLIRTYFKDLVHIHLSEYFKWLDSQYKGRSKLPEMFRIIPTDSLLSVSVRFLVTSAQLKLIGKNIPKNYLHINTENPLLIAAYGYGGNLYRAGWLKEGRVKSVPEGRIIYGKEEISVKNFSNGMKAVYIGPVSIDIEKSAFSNLKSALDAYALGKRGFHKFFRRDNYSYSDVVLTGIKLVILLLFIGVIVGIVFGFFRVFIKKVFYKKEGLEDEKVIRFYIDPLNGENKSKQKKD